jgi:hypothetical protein
MGTDYPGWRGPVPAKEQRSSKHRREQTPTPALSAPYLCEGKLRCCGSIPTGSGEGLVSKAVVFETTIPQVGRMVKADP